tara:strand:+ start:1671 stop:2273 length:603 start_codon:yes stop_codon:yes gene_type:complete
MKSLKKLFLAVITSGAVIACSINWTARPDNYESYKMCNPYSGDELQMMFIPGFEKAAVVVESCDYFRREKVSIALRVFEAEWAKSFGHSYTVSRNLEEMIVTFSFERKIVTGYDIFGRVITTGDLLGSTISKNAVWVYVKTTTERICDTSLAHELVHASIWSLNGTHGDPDHVGKKYPGWTMKHNMLVQNVNDHLCELGI